MLYVSTQDGGNVVSLDDLALEEAVDTIKITLEAETGVPAAEQALFFNRQELSGGMTLRACGVGTEDMLVMDRRPPRASPNTGGNVDIESLRTAILSNPHLMERVQEANPELVIAAHNPDPTVFRQAFLAYEGRRRQEEQARQQRLLELEANPFDQQAQKEIEEIIRMRNIDENYANAIEQSPESFGRVVMLFVDAEVHGHPVKAFVDSGAQNSIMSVDCARRCGIDRLIDRRFQGIALGVGSAKIVGRIHLVQLKLGASYLNISLTVLEQSFEFLFGLDMLRRHQCIIDLKRNCLRLSDDQAVPFLAEKDIPVHLRETGEAQRDALGGGALSATGTPVREGTPSASGPPPPPHPRGDPVVHDGISQADVERLMSLGFSRERVVEALRSTRGNAELAASLLFG